MIRERIVSGILKFPVNFKRDCDEYKEPQGRAENTLNHEIWASHLKNVTPIPRTHDYISHVSSGSSRV